MTAFALAARHRVASLGFFVVCAATFPLGIVLQPRPTSHPACPNNLPPKAQGLRPASAEGVGSTVAVGHLTGRTLAFVADSDEDALIVVDMQTRRAEQRIALGGTPAQLLLLREGPLVVALRNRQRLAVFDAAPDGFRERISVPTDAEPWGLAETPDGVLLATCATGQSLEGFRASDFSSVFRAKLPREPRAVYASPTHRRAYVSHLGEPLLSVVDLASTEPAVSTFPRTEALGARASTGAPSQGFSIARVGSTLVVPHITSFTGDATIRTQSTYGDVAFLQLGHEAAAKATVTDARDPVLRPSWAAYDCLLPRAALGLSNAYLLACSDSPEVIEIGANERRWRVGAGITGLALDPLGDRVLAWAQFDRKLGILSGGYNDTGGTHPASVVIDVPLSGRGFTDAFVSGRALFHASHDPRIASDGRACASCHPDGLDDGLTWPTPDGPRQTPSLRGRVAGTEPFGWLGTKPTLAAHLEQTVSRLGGSGLTLEEREALVTYVTSMHGPEREEPYATYPSDSLAHGREVFEDRCASCHDPTSAFTDGEVHDVRSRARGDRASAFNTPSLRSVASTAPYFHDGRYASLRALLVGSQGTMWKSPPGGLRESDLDALEDYLQAL